MVSFDDLRHKEASVLNRRFHNMFKVPVQSSSTYLFTALTFQSLF